MRVTASISLNPDTEIAGDVFSSPTGHVSGRLGIGQTSVWSSDPAQLRALAAKANEIADELEQAIASTEKVA
ncbi:MAG TPA: hypothetical protein VFU06_00055 [Longimicrobiales bacterium]|nr:hypothetical protein [Longimicrobiales bacterium]